MGQLRNFSVSRVACVAVTAVGVVVLGAGCGGSQTEEAKGPDSHMSSLGQDIITAQRSAAAYTEAVQVLVNNYATQGGTGDWCTGTLIAPQVVLTAAHCVAFNHSAGDAKTWTIVAPFAVDGSHTQTTAVSAGETIDPAGWAAVTRDDYYDYLYENRDIGLIYLPAPFTGIIYPTLSNTQYTSGSVSAIGRSAVSRNASLVLSTAVTLSGPAASYAFDNQTTRITDGGDSGGGLFLDGTHTIVGTESNFDDVPRDYWMRLDGGVYTFLQNAITNHGGAATTLTSFRDSVSSTLCTRVASCCAASTPGYAINSAECSSIYSKLGFDSTARGISNAGAQNVLIDQAKAKTCLTTIADGNMCTVDTADMQTAVANCVGALSGRVAVGGACKASLECAGSAGCSFNAFGNGTCTAIAAGASCQVAYVAGTTVDERDNMGQELCAKMAGPNATSFCDAYDFVADAYRAESAWKCATPKDPGAGCDTDQYCKSLICEPFGEATAYTCQPSAPFVTTTVCDAFKN